MNSLPPIQPTKSQLTYKHTYDITIALFEQIKRLWECPKNDKRKPIPPEPSEKKEFDWDDMWGQFEPLD